MNKTFLLLLLCCVFILQSCSYIGYDLFDDAQNTLKGFMPKIPTETEGYMSNGAIDTGASGVMRPDEDIVSEKDVPVEEVPAEETPVEEAPAEETPIEELPEIYKEENIYNNENLSSDKAEKIEYFTQQTAIIKEYAATESANAVTQVEINEASYNIYMKWDMLLNEVYNYLRTVLSKEEFADLTADEIEWIKEKEAAVEAEGELWGSGTGRGMAMNSVAADYTEDRCYYLISLIK